MRRLRANFYSKQLPGKQLHDSRIICYSQPITTCFFRNVQRLVALLQQVRCTHHGGCHGAYADTDGIANFIAVNMQYLRRNRMENPLGNFDRE